MTRNAADLDASIANVCASLSELVRMRAEIAKRELASVSRRSEIAETRRGLTIPEAAAHTGLSRSTVTRLVAQGALEAYGGARGRRILPETLAGYMGRQSSDKGGM